MTPSAVTLKLPFSLYHGVVPACPDSLSSRYVDLAARIARLRLGCRVSFRSFAIHGVSHMRWVAPWYSLLCVIEKLDFSLFRSLARSRAPGRNRVGALYGVWTVTPTSAIAASALQLFCRLCVLASELLPPSVLPGAAEMLRVLCVSISESWVLTSPFATESPSLSDINGSFCARCG